MSINEVKAYVEKCLSEKDYKGLDKFLDQSEAKKYMAEDQSMYIMGILCEVQRIENENGITKGFLSCRSIQEAVETYRLLVLLLRRLEFDLPYEYQREIMAFINVNEISVIGVWAVVQGTKYLYAKELIIERFKNLF